MMSSTQSSGHGNPLGEYPAEVREPGCPRTWPISAAVGRWGPQGRQGFGPENIILLSLIKTLNLICMFYI